MANAERIEFESATLFKELVDKGQLKSLISVKSSPYPKYCFKNTESKKYYYNDFDGKKVEYVLEKGLSLSQKMSFVVEVAGTVVSKEVGYAQVLRQPMFEYCLITYYTNIVLFENGEEFSLDKVDKFIKDNKENVLNVIRENVSADERAELDDACNEAIEYRKLHYNDLKDEIEDLLQVVREFVVKPDYMNELLQALTNAVNTFADRGDIDYEAVIKLADIIPIMQRLDSKDVAKAIVEEFHNEKVLSQVVSKPSTKSNKGRKPKTEFTVEKGEKTE